MDKRLAIFDLDGTLYDTRPVNYMSYKLALQDFNVTLSRDYFYQHCNGQYYKHFLPVLAPFLTVADMEIIHEKKKELYSTCLTSAVANDNLVDVIRCIRPRFHTALVTTASAQNAYEIMNYFGHVDLFDLILTQDDVKKKKPDPECFLKAMTYFKASPSSTIIFEDSEFGVQAAILSGASVCRILDFLQ